MKKIFTTLFILSGIYFSATAQKAQSFEFGVNAGLNIATVTNSQNSSSTTQTGFNAGISGEYYFSQAWGLKAKFNYDQKGWGNGFIQNGSTVIPTSFKVNYITVPVLASWHFGHTRNWYLHFGPYLGFLASATASTNGQDVKSYFNDTDAGLDVGIGVKIKVAEKTKLFFEYDGQAGVSDIFKTNTGSQVLNSRSSLSVGLAFSVQ